MGKESNYQILKSLDEKKFKSYCDFFKKHDLEEFYLNENGLEISLKTKPAQAQVTSQQQSYIVPQSNHLSNHLPVSTNVVAEAQPSLEQDGSGVANAPLEADEKDDYEKITSPTAGTFYTSPSPDSPPFITEGQKIKKGDKVCIIEAMKVLNEIKSDKDGEVYKILVKDKENVEQGQAIILLK